MRRVAEPYAIAYVTLDEGVTMLTNLVDCDFERCRSGLRCASCSSPRRRNDPDVHTRMIPMLDGAQRFNNNPWH